MAGVNNQQKSKSVELGGLGVLWAPHGGLGEFLGSK